MSFADLNRLALIPLCVVLATRLARGRLATVAWPEPRRNYSGFLSSFKLARQLEGRLANHGRRGAFFSRCR